MACTNPILESLLKFRNYTFSSLKKEFDIQESDIITEVEYLKLKDLTVIDKEGILPGSFYFSGENLTMIYIEDPNILSTLSVEEILETCGEGEVLRSRAGKTSIMHVYPEQGFALSTSGKSLDFMEVFPPTSIENYKRKVYKEVLFRK